MNARLPTTEPLHTSTPDALIDHILVRYHAVHRQQFPELIRLARKVEAVHRAHPQAPNGLAELLAAMEQDLLSHMQKEEAILFPMLRAGGNPLVQRPIAMMRAEHLQHGAMLERLAEITQGATLPEGACNTWRALYDGIAQMHDDLLSHIELENEVLFAPFEAIQPTAPHATCCGACGG